MNEVSGWFRDMGAAAASFGARILDFVPTLFGAIAILVAGWLIARLTRSAIVRLVRWINDTLESQLGPDRARPLRLSEAAIRLLGSVTFWVIILIFITVATRVLGLDAFSAWLDRVVAYLPTLVAGALIVLVGLLISALASELTSAAAASAGIPHAELVGRIAQATILITALILGINQIGIDVTLLITLIAIVVAAGVGSLALAFALGSRGLVSNLIASHYLQLHYRPGQRARMGEVSGEILELTPVSVVLAAKEGRVFVPARVFTEQTTALLNEETADG